MPVNNREPQTMAALYLSMDDMVRVDPCLVVHVDEEESVTSSSASETWAPSKYCYKLSSPINTKITVSLQT